MKKVLLSLFVGIMLLLPMTVKAEGKVKVYVFEAGGCPYCELEVEYLEGLESYGKKFEIVRKELYVDHVNWEPGKDYELGVKVANAFTEEGFEDASVHGTPFVVISNIYAKTAYNADLAKIIDEAFEKGDKDVVTCLANNGTSCLKDAKEFSDAIPVIILSVAVVGLVVMIVLARISNKEEKILDKAFAPEEDEKPVAQAKEETVKVVAEKKPVAKKPATKVTAKKESSIKKTTVKRTEGKAKVKAKASESKKTTKSTKKPASKK